MSSGTLGSGEVSSHADRPIIHFGSPPGVTYEQPEDEPEGDPDEG